MMSNRTLAILSIVAVILMAIVTAPAWWPSSDQENGSGRSQAGKTELDPLGLAGIDIDDVEKLVIKKNGGVNVTVARNDDDWMIGKKHADAKKIEAFFKAIHSASKTKSELISRTKGRHASLELTDDMGTIVTVTQTGEDDISFIIGKIGDSVSSWYGRVRDQDQAWLLESDLSSLLPADKKAWETAESAKDSSKVKKDA